MTRHYLLLPFLFLLAQPALHADDLLAKRLSVSFVRTPLKQAMDEVARLADFEWSYNAKILDHNRLVTVMANNWTLREILQEMLGNEYAFKSNGRYLILKPQKLPRSVLSGVVRDPKTGERLANTTVYDRKSLRATVTDSSGYYRLKVKGKSALVVSRLGYRDTVLQVSSITPRFQKIELSAMPVVASDSAAKPQLLKQKIHKTIADLEAFFDATGDKWHELNVPDTLRRHFQLSLVPVIGSNHLLSGKVENDWSVNIVAGVSAGVRNLEVAGVANFTRKRVRGAQAAGVFNLNEGDCLGAQAAGVFNLSHGDCTGAQLAGVFNHSGGDCRGIQAAGVFNHSAKTINGAQFAGVLNIAHYSPHFLLQSAGVLNVLRSTDITGDSIPSGLQLAGAVNSADQLKGVQVAALVNHAQRIRGLQVGLINSADELHGVQIGLINRAGKRWRPILNWSGVFKKGKG